MVETIYREILLPFDIAMIILIQVHLDGPASRIAWHRNYRLAQSPFPNSARGTQLRH